MKDLWWRIRHFFEKLFNKGYTKEMKGVLDRTAFLIRRSQWSYKTWAKMLGCDERKIRKIAHKKIILSYPTLQKIAKFSGVEMHWLLTGKGKKEI